MSSPRYSISKNATRTLPKGMSDLIDLIVWSIEEAGINNKKLISLIAKILYGDEQIGKDGNHLKAILAGDKAPSILWLIGLYAALHAEGDHHRILHRKKDIQKWLTYWLGHRIEFEKKNNIERKTRRRAVDDKVVSKWTMAIDDLKKSLVVETSLKPLSSKLPTLDRFPGAFHPLIIITGASQIFPPEKVEDLFRKDAQLTDLSFICGFNFAPDTLVVPDRLLIAMDDDQRRDLLHNKHILSIGGPLVNVFTRHLCDTSVFGFQFHERHKEFKDIFDYIQRQKVLVSSGHISLFYKFLNAPNLRPPLSQSGITKADQNRIFELAKEIRRKADMPHGTYQEVMRIFMPIGIFDPVKLQTSTPLDENDIGMIGVSPNIWDRDRNMHLRYQYLAVIVAGFHALGAAQALKALARPRNFTDRPLGGFLKASEGQMLPRTPYNRFVKGRYDWDEELLTPPYSINTITDKLVEQLKLPRNKRLGAMQKLIDENTVKALIEFLKRF